MKADEAPEKLYVHIKDKPCEITFSEVIEKECSNIEYIRTDAFIEKVINFLNYKLDDVVATRVIGTIIPHHVAKQELIEDFRKYMEDES